MDCIGIYQVLYIPSWCHQVYTWYLYLYEICPVYSYIQYDCRKVSSYTLPPGEGRASCRKKEIKVTMASLLSQRMPAGRGRPLAV